MNDTEDFYAPRRCLREPIPEIFFAANLLDQAVDAHLSGDHTIAEALIRAADIPEVGQWVDSLWGSAKNHPNQAKYLRVRTIEGAPPTVPKQDRIKERMPSASERRMIVERWGYNCAFCGIPVIRKEVRCRMRKAYPNALRWGSQNAKQHAAFQCLWLQYDHIVPHARGGGNDPSNIIVTCSGCNYGKGNYVLAEQGLMDPRQRSINKTNWDGLERFV